MPPSAEARFESAFSYANAAVAEGRIPGGVLGFQTSDGQRVTRAVGHAALVPEPRNMEVGTWFDLASLTKVIFTTTRILSHWRAGRIDLDAPISEFIPDFRQYEYGCWERQVTIRQCLGHITPFPAVFPIYTYGNDPDTLRAFVLQHEWPKGAPVYSDINFILLGIALERVENRTIRDMDPGPGFAWSGDPTHTAATEHCRWRNRILCGDVHDENCFALAGSGHAGLFGSIGPVLDFANSLLQTAEAPEVAILLQKLREGRGHGWQIPGEGWLGGGMCSARTVGHTGFTGTGLWVDFEKGQAWSLLTNRVHPSRHVETGINDLRIAVGTEICKGE